MTHSLFSYGTLQNQEVQHALFGRTVPSQPGCVDGWARFMGDDGYLFIKPRIGSRISGVILTLSDRELHRADLWEDLTVYRRESCRVVLQDSSHLNAQIYTRRNTPGTLYEGDGAHGRSIREIIDEISLLLKNIP
jgi:gamma-glutamylcyclotransferase (GGCT)/AIG2-like uncharacterized protein YtfP